jgi:hypothetical protein
MRTGAALVVLIVAWLLWPTLSTQQHQKVEWTVTSTPAYKGHPTDQPDTVECSRDLEDIGATKIIVYKRWRELELNDVCPEEDR